MKPTQYGAVFALWNLVCGKRKRASKVDEWGQLSKESRRGIKDKAMIHSSPKGQTWDSRALRAEGEAFAGDLDMSCGLVLLGKCKLVHVTETWYVFGRKRAGKLDEILKILHVSKALKCNSTDNGVREGRSM